MTKTMELTEIPGRLAELAESARKGDEIILEKPVGKRKAGLGQGEGWIHEDFDAPLPIDEPPRECYTGSSNGGPP